MVVCLGLLSFVPATGYAADEVVKSIEWENDSPVHIYVDHNTYQLKVLAEVAGLTMKKDVTEEAYWLSSNPATVKVEKGLLSALKNGSSKISAKYKGFSITVDVTSEYLFKEIRLNQNENIQVELGDPDLALSAFAVEQDSTSNEITTNAEWSSSNTAVATVSKGKVIAKSKGTAVITVKYKGMSDTVEVKVVSPYSSIDISSIGGLEYYVGDETISPLIAVAKLVGGSTEDVTERAEWTSSNSKVAQVEKGRLTLLTAGTAKITASYLGVTKEVSVIVRLPYQALVLTPTGDRHMFIMDEPLQVQAQVMNDASNKLDVTALAKWTSSNSMAVTVANGKITPKATGAASISAEYKGITKSINITVLPTLLSMEIKDKDLQLFRNETKALPVVTGTALDGDTYDFSPIAEWKSSDDRIIKIENGKMIADKPGTAVLTATIRGFSTVVQVKVMEKVLALLPSSKAVSIIVGQEVSIPAVRAIFEDGTEEALTNQITWKTSTPNVLVKDGKLRGLLQGKLTLTGTYLNKTITIPVTLEEEITEFRVEPDSLELNIGQSKSVKVTGVYKDGTTTTLTSKITWDSAAPNVAVMKGSFVKAAAIGQTVLSGSYQGKKIQLIVKVVPKLVKLEADEKSYSLAAGGSAVIALRAIYDNGIAADISTEAVWSSTNLGVVQVDKGHIKALKKGSASVKATFKGKSVTFRVTVK
jgi:alkyl hydroperoxide reductase subunit AhpC